MADILSGTTAGMAISAIAGLALTGTALAADLGHKVAAPMAQPVAAPFNWSGWNIGIQAGYGWGRESDNFSYIPNVLDHYNVSGAIGGAHVGYDLQTNNFVFGLVTDLNFAGISGDGSTTFDTFEGIGISSLSLKNSWQASMRARAGFTLNQMLFYGTGGIAFADAKLKYTVDDPVFGVWSGSQTKVLTGWTAGGGVEFAIDPRWSAALEVRYTDFGKESFSVPASMGIGSSYKAGFDETVATVAISYHF